MHVNYVFLQNADNPTDPVTMDLAMVAGVELVYFIAFAMSIVAVILAFFVYRAVPKEMKESPEQEEEK